MLTPADIRKPRNVSGYAHVGLVAGPSRGSSAPYYQAYEGGGRGGDWKGPARPTGLLAAQDYCDHVNGLSTPRLPDYDRVTVDMGTRKRHAPRAEKVTVVREKYVGPHDVYDVVFYDPQDGNRVVRRKVGITARGRARYADVCKTLGLSIRPVSPAVTFPSEDAARVAEMAKVAEVCKDPNWKRVGREAFAPVRKKEATTS